MRDLFDKIVQKLSDSKVEQPRLEARLLLAHVKKCLPADIYSGTDVSETETQVVTDMLNRRLAHEPLDKILGHRAFFKADFVVNNKVLSPRPDTETLVECVLENYANRNTNWRILDLGTGSGCIIESLLAEYPNARGMAVDISAEALNVAKMNAEKLGLSQQLEFIQADWFAAGFVQKIGQVFDIIVTNPPYIASSEINTLEPEVKDYDPLLALDGGEDGFDSYCRLAEVVPELLVSGGKIFIEAGAGQARTIADIFMKKGLFFETIHKDLSGIERCVILRK